jgi:hypothetical protein
VPKGPRGEKRPADAIGPAVMVARIATERDLEIAAAQLGSKRG